MSASVEGTDWNSSTYKNVRVVQSYAAFDALFPAETDIFSRYARQFSGDVLDIAIGAGRTTRELLPKARKYVGSDFSAGMVSLAKASFPNADLRQLDMRSVPREYAGQRFDAVLISFNGIDYIPWEDRNTLLAALRNMLKPDGVLAFSSHDLAAVNENRRFRIRADLRPQWREFFTTPATAAKRLLKLPFWIARALPSYLKYRPLEKIYDGFAYVNDSGENYGLLTCYVSVARQTRVLEAAGYRNVRVLQPWLEGEQAAFNYFVCRPMSDEPLNA
jgi:SAM-dependent methyltransferase